MTRPKLVIFDCDGVLVDSEPITNQLLRDDLAGRGLDLPLEDVMRKFVGGTMKAVGEEARNMGADMPDYWVDGFYKKMYAALASGTPLIAGVETVLDKLDAAGIPYCVGSNGSEAKMAITMGQHPQLYSRVKHHIYSAHTHGIAKPDPGLFLIAASDFDVAPSDCVVVDDSASGCRAAVSAGMRCLGFAEHDDGAKLRSLGAEPFHKMSELPTLLSI